MRPNRRKEATVADLRNIRCKTFELRDHGTFIPVIAVLLNPIQPGLYGPPDIDEYLLRRGGWAWYDPQKPADILLMHLQTNESHSNEFEWGPINRTMKIAHEFIQKQWANLRDAEVIDVAYILRETNECKKSER